MLALLSHLRAIKHAARTVLSHFRPCTLVYMCKIPINVCLSSGIPNNGQLALELVFGNWICCSGMWSARQCVIPSSDFRGKWNESLCKTLNLPKQLEVLISRCRFSFVSEWKPIWGGSTAFTLRLFFFFFFYSWNVLLNCNISPPKTSILHQAPECYPRFLPSTLSSQATNFDKVLQRCI